MAEKGQENSAAAKEKRRRKRDGVKAKNAALGAALKARTPSAAAPAEPESVRRHVATAARALRKFQRAGDVASEGTTPERLARAGSDAKVETFSAGVEVFRNGRVEADTVERHRLRLDDSPLDRLAARKLLSPDPTLNAALFHAGDRFRKDFYKTGLAGVGAIDPSQPVVSGGGGGLLRTDSQVVAWQRYTAASAAIPEQSRPVVEAIALFDREPVDVGRGLTNYSDPTSARAVALYQLKLGLQALAKHFGLVHPTPKMGA